MNKMEVVKDFDNKLLNRRELIVNINDNGATPTRDSIKKELVKKFKAKEELVVVNKIDTSYGSTGVEVQASIYKDSKTLDTLTSKHMLKRNESKAPKVEPEVEAAPAVEAPAPVEEAKEEVKKEAPVEEAKEE